MIPVHPQNEPASFDKRVRQPGLLWLGKKNIPLKAVLQPGTKIKPYWRRSLDDLHKSYDGVCAYLCVFVERVAGGVSVDHYLPKSRQAGLAYEWSNFRLACMTMNSRKMDFSTVLDPFVIGPDTFRLELVTGRIYIRPDLLGAQRSAAQDTITRLRLDSYKCREMRARHYEKYREFGWPESWLQQYSPFVWVEANRQGLL